MDPTDPLLGQVIDGRYKIVQRLSAGGAGVVYRARHLRLDRSLAIKVLTGGLETDEEAVIRFEREAKLTSRLNHPNIIEITDFGVDEKFGLYLVMEFVPGITVRQMVNWNGPLELPSMLEIAIQVCSGMSEAHSAAIIHRDLKAHNLMVIEKDDGAPLVKILDFGIAGLTDADDGPSRLTRTGMLMGTPAYMSPEQAIGRRADHLADIYAVGVVMYEMLAGKVPLRGSSPLETLEFVQNKLPTPFEEFMGRKVPRELEEIVFDCLAKKKYDRPQSFKMVQSRLEDMMSHVADGEQSVGSTTLSLDLNRIRVALDSGTVIDVVEPEPDAFDTTAEGLEALARLAEGDGEGEGSDLVMVDPIDLTGKPAEAEPLVRAVGKPGPAPTNAAGQTDLTERVRVQSGPPMWRTIATLLGASALGGLAVYFIGNLLFN